MDQRAYHRSIRAVAKHGGRFGAMMKLTTTSFLFLLLLISIDASSSDPRHRKTQDIRDPLLSLPDNDGVSSSGGSPGDDINDSVNDFPGPDGDPLEVVGGTNAEQGEYPTFVRMFGCGGNLISPNWVLTAAHCVCPWWDGAGSTDLCNEPGVKDFAGTIYVGAYENEGQSFTGFKRTCDEMILHPFYGSAHSNGDIALCKLSEPVWSIEPMTIDTEFLGNDVDVQIIGFGSTTANPDPPYNGIDGPPLILQKADSKTADCLRMNPPETRSDSVCLQSVPSICGGDSGGPLIIEKGGEKVQVGVVSGTSGGSGCKGSDEEPNQIFARVSLDRGAYKFIQKTVCKDDPSESATLCALPKPAPTTAPTSQPISAPISAPTSLITSEPTSESTCTCRKNPKNKRF